jgi:hypothetical protein
MSTPAGFSLAQVFGKTPEAVNRTAARKTPQQTASGLKCGEKLSVGFRLAGFRKERAPIKKTRKA